MARVIGGVNFSETILDALEGELEEGLELRRGSLSFSCEGVWHRQSNGDSVVVLLPNTGTLGSVRPVPGDKVAHTELDEVMAVMSVGGMDDVIWELTCAPALDDSHLTDAPTLSVRHLGATNWESSVDEPLVDGTRLRTRFRRAGKPYWMGSRIQDTRHRLFTLPTGGEPYEVGAAFIASDGTASLEAIAEAA